MKSMNKLNKYIFGLLLIVLNLLLLFYLWYDVKAIEQEDLISNALADINQLYFDEQHDFLAANITQEQIDEKANKYSDIEDDEVSSIIDDVQKKYTIIENLNTIYSAEEPMIVGNQVSDHHQLNPELTQSNLKCPNYFDSDKLNEDRLLKAASEKYAYAENTLATIEKIDSTFSEMDQNISTESIHQTLDEITNVQPLLEEIADQPQTPELKEQYDGIVQQITEVVHKNVDYVNEDTTLNDKIFSNEDLAAQLLGSEVDHRPLIALTFDDGPSEATLPILDILDKHDVPGTFFQLGSQVIKYPEISQMILDRGHRIGNHSFSHANFSVISDDEVRHEMNQTQDAIFNATGEMPVLYRMPYGNGGMRVVNMFPDLQTIFWNIDSLDWHYRNSDQTINEIINTIKQRSIVLMHDIYFENVETLDYIIPYLKEQGYVFCFPDQILDADTYLN